MLLHSHHFQTSPFGHRGGWISGGHPGLLSCNRFFFANVADDFPQLPDQLGQPLAGHRREQQRTLTESTFHQIGDVNRRGQFRF